ncbi:MAG: NUDIX domain-containing protein [Nanoarchaeota archaeon]|nr:NUDIX domain-containing protein [Nanoarchaeota archaeon]
MEEVSKLFVATKAFIKHNGKILLLKESPKYKDGTNIGKYDVPGGRVEPGQHFQESLIREIKEETGLSVRIGKPFHVGEWRPFVKGEKWQIVGTFFECEAESNDVQLGEDHEEFLWIDPKDYQNYNLIETIKPAFKSYLGR